MIILLIIYKLPWLPPLQNLKKNRFKKPKDLVTLTATTEWKHREDVVLSPLYPGCATAQIFASAPELTSSQPADGRTENRPQGSASLFVPALPSPLQGKTQNKQPLCLEQLPRTETQLFAWHCQTAQWTGNAHKSYSKWVSKDRDREREKSTEKELWFVLAYIQKRTHTVQ